MPIKNPTGSNIVKHELISGTIDDLDKLANLRVEEGYILYLANMVSFDPYNRIVTIFYVWSKLATVK